MSGALSYLFWIAILALLGKVTVFNLGRELFDDIRMVPPEKRRDIETLEIASWGERLFARQSGRNFQKEAVSFGWNWGEFFSRRWPHLIVVNAVALIGAALLLALNA